MGRLKFECNPGLMTTLSDRFSGVGYKKEIGFDEGLATVARMDEVDGVGFWGPGQVTLDNCLEVKEKVEKIGKKPGVIVVANWGPEWRWGAFSSKSQAVREASVQLVCEAMDIAEKMGIGSITIWPAHDGVDYPFQADFSKVWDWMVDCTIKCAEYKPNIKIGIEYKIREPRIHQFVANIGDTISMIKDVNRDNVGALLDFGHSLQAGENIAYSAVRLLEMGKLYNAHWGDNFRHWDDDVIVGSVNPLDFIELVYWLHRYDFDGWNGLDQYPFKNDAYDAATESVNFVRGCENLIDFIGMDEIGTWILDDEPKKALSKIREAMFDFRKK